MTGVRSAAVHLGEVLIGTGVIDAGQLAAALRQQVIYGGRLGTNLIELGYCDFDAIAHGLARLHGVPAALNKHLKRLDPRLRNLIPPELAMHHGCFPVALTAGGDGQHHLVVCFRNPQAAQSVREIERIAKLPVVVSVTPEIAIYRWLSSIYGLPCPQRFAVPAPKSPLPSPRDSGEFDVVDPDAIDIDLDEAVEELPPTFQLVDLDDSAVSKDLSHYVARRNSRAVLPTAPKYTSANASLAITAPPAPEPPAPEPAAPAAPPPETPPVKIAAPPTSPAPAPMTAAAVATAPSEPSLSLAEASAAIDTAGDRDEVATAITGYLRGAFGAGIVLVVRDELALGLTGVGGTFSAETVETIVVPLSVPTVFRTAFNSRSPYRGPVPGGLHPVQDRFLKNFGADDTAPEVMVVPILIRDRVVCLVYAQRPDDRALDNVACDGLRQLCNLAEGAFLRLIHESKRAKRPTGARI